jgi:excisionase family DNA binding protein
MPYDIPVKEAARRLGVSERWLRRLAARGDLRSRRVGSSYLVDPNDLARLKRSVRAPGRPMSARSAWALLAVLSGEEPAWISASARSRLRSALRYGAHPADLLRRSQPRSEVVEWRVLESDLAKVQADHSLVRTGLSRDRVDLDLVWAENSEALDAYVTREAVDVLRRRLAPETAPSEPNLVLRVPFEPWVLKFSGEAPAAVVAADLLDHDDARVSRAGADLLERLHRDHDS